MSAAVQRRLTEADLDAHIAGKGPVLRRLPNGRDVLDTGRVLIGARAAQTPSPAMSADAERLQAALIDPPPRRRWALSASDPADRMVMRACFVAVVVLVAMALGGWL